MTQKPPTNKRIARQKKAQAGISLAGGTLGLAALASRGKGAQMTRMAGKAGGAKATALANAGRKWNERSNLLTTAGAGIGGVGAYNFASYTNADAKKQAKLKKNLDPFEISKAKRDELKNNVAAGAAAGGSIGAIRQLPKVRSGLRAARADMQDKKSYDAEQKLKTGKPHFGRAIRGISGAGQLRRAAGVGSIARTAALGGVASAAYHKVKKNDPFEVSKLGSPKVKYQELTAHVQDGNTTTRHDADTVETNYKGKSLILRRPKYQAVGYPSKVANKLKAGDHISATPNLRATKTAARALHEAHKGKKKTVKFDNGHKLRHEVGKSSTISAFGVDHGW